MQVSTHGQRAQIEPVQIGAVSRHPEGTASGGERIPARAAGRPHLQGAGVEPDHGAGHDRVDGGTGRRDRHRDIGAHPIGQRRLAQHPQRDRIKLGHARLELPARQPVCVADPQRATLIHEVARRVPGAAGDRPAVLIDPRDGRIVGVQHPDGRPVRCHAGGGAADAILRRRAAGAGVDGRDRVGADQLERGSTAASTEQQHGGEDGHGEQQPAACRQRRQRSPSRRGRHQGVVRS